MTRATAVLGGFLACLIGACTVTVPEGRFACVDDGQCPSGWSCVAARCYAHAPDAGDDSGHDMDSAIDAADSAEAGVDAQADAADDAPSTIDAADGMSPAPDGGDMCEPGFERRNNTCSDIDECARPSAPTVMSFNANQADTAAFADDAMLTVSGAWLQLGASFRLGVWSDDSDLCGLEPTTRDAFFKIRLTRETTLALRAANVLTTQPPGDTKLVLAVFPGDVHSFTLGRRAVDVQGSQVPCLAGALTLDQTVTLAAGSYYVVVKANAACDFDVATCTFDGNAAQDDAFTLEIRDTSLPLFPCDTAPLATCDNTQGSFGCSCPAGTGGDGVGPTGCD